MRRWWVWALAVAGVAAMSLGGYYALMVFTLFSDRDPGPAPCERGFDADRWKRERISTGRAIAECGWFDGTSVAQVRAALGRPDDPPYRGWHTWSLGSSRNGIGPSAWFLSLRVRDGRVVRSDAETRAI
jgi:hypothetical protein